jgi:hypothetical protein
MHNVARATFRLLVGAVLVGAVGEFVLAGLAVFTIAQAASAGQLVVTDASFQQQFSGHLLLGDAVDVASLLVPLIAIFGRATRQFIALAGGLTLLVLFQATLAFAGGPAVEALHPAAGVAIVLLSIYLLRAAPRGWSATAAG